MTRYNPEWISYNWLFDQLKKGREFSIVKHDERRFVTLLSAGIIIWNKDRKTFSLHPEQIERMAAKAAQNEANQATTDAPRMVHVDWSGRGHSSGKYKVLSETERYVTIEFHLERKMTVSKARVKDAA